MLRCCVRELPYDALSHPLRYPHLRALGHRPGLRECAARRRGGRAGAHERDLPVQRRLAAEAAGGTVRRPCPAPGLAVEAAERAILRQQRHRRVEAEGVCRRRVLTRTADLHAVLRRGGRRGEHADEDAEQERACGDAGPRTTGQVPRAVHRSTSSLSAAGPRTAARAYSAALRRTLWKSTVSTLPRSTRFSRRHTASLHPMTTASPQMNCSVATLSGT